MNYYSTQISEDSYIRIPMMGSLSPDAALLLGALVASKNSNLATLMEKRGELLLGCVIASLIEGADDLGSQESVSLSKMLVSDIVNLLFQAFDTLEQSIAESVSTEESEAEAESVAPELSAVEEASEEVAS